ncbi:MAG: glycine/betaine ABC transporter permease [Actinomycetota bacterium]|nr:MAG: glycine/betaine ABC transporter permease [Actinomycetota bacterium]
MERRLGGPPRVATVSRPPVGVSAQRTWARRGAWLLALGAVVALGLRLPDGFPERWVIDLAKSFNAFQDWVITNQRTHPLFRAVLVPLKDLVNVSFDGIVRVLSRMTWFGLIVTLSLVSGVLAGWRKGLLAAAGFGSMALLGLWPESVETLALMVMAVVAALAIGIPLGIVAGRRPLVDRLLRPVLDGMQTIPAFSYLVPLVLLFSIGTTTALIATIVFAVPPAIRLTSLGVRLVSRGAIEVAESFGATRRQMLRKVQLPLAKPHIMLGVNQTIMMALGMVVIASSVGFRGLGRVVYNALQRRDVGEALAGGIAIVLLAIVLDRVTMGWGERDRRRRGASRLRIGARALPRWAPWAVMVVGASAAVLVGREVLRQQDFPSTWALSISDPVNRAVAWLTLHVSDVTEAMTASMIRFGLDPLRDLLLGVPWWMVAGAAAVAAWKVSRRPGLTVLSFSCIAGVGLVGMWDISMDTLSQVIVAVASSVVLAIPIGIWSAWDDRVQRALRPILDAMQTMPQFVYLVPVVALFGVGRVPGVIAALVYALPPGIRLTDTGIRQVPRETVEAALAFGSTRWQVLTKVQLPLARPSILLGVNQTVMMVLSVVIIAGLVGGGGLGYEVIQGLSHDPGRGMVAGICILLLAIVIDRITQMMGRVRGASGPETSV